MGAPPTPAAARLLPIVAVRVGPRRRPLDPAVVARLADSITRVGLLHPVTVTPDCLLVAGHHRLEACRGLGWSDVPATVAEGDDLHTRLAELDENLVRNDLTELERAEHLQARNELLAALGVRARTGDNQHTRAPAGGPATVAGPPKTTAAVAAEVGLSDRTARRLTSIARRIVPEARALLHGTAAGDQQKSLLLVANQPPDVQLQLATYLNTHPQLAASTVHKQLKRDEVAYGISQRAAMVAVVDGVVGGDFREVTPDVLPDASVDLVFTDPPYDAAGVPLYGALGAFAARVLRPGGLLMAYASQAHLTKIGTLLDSTDGLRYLWTCCLHRQAWTRMEGERVYSQWRPLLWYVKPPLRFHWDMFEDVVRAPKEKGLFHWQQSEAEAAYFIQRLAPTGALVVDPMCGSGTTLAAAKGLGRRFLGMEIDAARAALARERLTGRVAAGGAGQTEDAAG